MAQSSLHQAGRWTEWVARLAVVTLYLALATVYNLQSPLFEAPDEIWHYLYVRHLAAGQGLPEQGIRNSSIWAQQEADQPPLYYLVAAALSAAAPRESLPDLVHENTHASVGDPTSDRNKNRFVHRPIEAFPWPGEVLAVRLARLASTLFGGLTVALTFQIAREIWPKRLDLAVGAALVNAAIPQFAYIGGAVSNDTAAAATASLVLWLGARLLRSGPNRRRMVGMGLAVGLAIMTKFGGISTIAIPIVALAGWQLRQPQRRESVRALVRSVALLAVTIAITTGWWFARNYARSGELVPLRTFLGRARLDDQVPSLIQIIHDMPGLWMSFWAVFGWFSILVSPEIYQYYTVLALLALALLIVGTLREGRAHQTELPMMLLLVFWITIVVAALLRYRLIVLAFQGRLLFPAVSAFAILLYRGFAYSVPLSWRWLVPAITGMALIPLAAALPFQALAPAYRPPPIRTVEELGVPSHPATARFGEGIELVGYDLLKDVSQPGGSVGLTLYWRARRATPHDYTVFVHLRDPHGRLLAQSDSFPGGGNFATSLWKPGDAFTDEVRLRIPPTVPTPVRASLYLGLYEAHSQQRAPVTQQRFSAVSAPGSAGPDELLLGSIHLTGDAPASFPNPIAITFGDQITVRGYTLDHRSVSPGGSIQGRLYYEALAPVSQDLTVFVHLSDDQRAGPASIVAQQDQQPVNGDYPTSFWQVGEIVPHTFTLTIGSSVPPGQYTVLTGLYDLKTGVRLRTADGDTLRLGTITVEPR